MIRFALAQIIAHRLRLALTVIAVMLGVAFVSGSLVLNDTAQKLFDEQFATAAAGADVNALTAEGAPPAIHLAKLAGHEDVAALLLAHGYEPPRLKPISPELKSADATDGRSIFDKACARCHRLTETFLAAPLEGVVGRVKASIAHQEYSDALRAAGGNWTYEDLNAFIHNPGAIIPGTSMSFWGVPDDGERADLILYLRNQSADRQPLP